MEINKPITVPVETVGQAYLEILRARGIKYFFGNSGTDFGPIIDGLAKFAAEKKEFPKPITVPHEFVAVSMAQGYAMITGEPQVVMVHVIVGTGNASAAVMNASRLNVPMIFSAGRTPLTEEGLRGSRTNFIHWGQESFDQGSLLREFTRWDYELRNGDQVETVVDRALEMTLGTPQGPVYLTLPREVLAQKMDSITIHPYRKAKAEALQPSAETIRRTAESGDYHRPVRFRSHRGERHGFICRSASGAGGHPRKPLREFPQHPRFSPRRQFRALRQRRRCRCRGRVRRAMVSVPRQAS